MERVDISAAVRDEFRRAGLWTDEHITTFAQRAKESTPRRLAVADESDSLTYEELWGQATRVAGWLRKNGVAPLDTVSVQLPNWWEFVVLHLAVDMLGAVLNPLLPIYRRHELSHAMNTCGSRVYVIPQAYRSFDAYTDMATELFDEVPTLRRVLVVRGAPPSDGRFAAFEEATASSPISAPVVRTTGDDPVLVAFTSGTEAAAKGCVHSSNTTVFGLRATASALEMTSDDVVFMPSPLGHATGVQWGLKYAMYLGSTLVLQDQWSSTGACEMIERWGCTFALAATPFVLDLVEHVERGHSHDLSRFRMFVSGGAPIPRGLVSRTRVALNAELLACYGQAECFIAVLNRPDDPLDAKQNFDGRPLPGVQIRAVDDAGEDVMVGADGECWTRGPHVMLGYVNPPADKQPYVPGHWLRTGDYVRLDERGFLAVVGRKKEIIIRGGINISPREIEEALLKHPNVARAAVVGYPDARLGQRTCAFVIPRDTPPTLEGLAKHLRALGMAAYKLPERLELVAEFPMTASGKVQKNRLEALLVSGGKT